MIWSRDDLRTRSRFHWTWQPCNEHGWLAEVCATFPKMNKKITLFRSLKAMKADESFYAQPRATIVLDILVGADAENSSADIIPKISDVESE
jgi:hypothetical protein